MWQTRQLDLKASRYIVSSSVLPLQLSPLADGMWPVSYVVGAAVGVVVPYQPVMRSVMAAVVLVCKTASFIFAKASWSMRHFG